MNFVQEQLTRFERKFFTLKPTLTSQAISLKDISNTIADFHFQIKSLKIILICTDCPYSFDILQNNVHF